MKFTVILTTLCFLLFQTLFLSNTVQAADVSKEVIGLPLSEALYKTLEAQDWKTMNNAAKQAIKYYPDEAIGYFYMGVALCEHRKYKKSIQYYNKAIELLPDASDNYQNRGWSYYLMGDRENALKDYDKALELNPDNEIAIRQRGLLLKGSKPHIYVKQTNNI